MDLGDLEGRRVVAVVLRSEAVSPEYIRGIAQSESGELRVVGEDGQAYDVPASFASVAQPVSDGVRAAAPAALKVLLADAEFIVPIPPPDGHDIALAVTPGWPNPPAT